MQDLSKVIKDRIKNYDNIIRETETGYVIEVGDGIARIHGLDACMAGELIEMCIRDRPYGKLYRCGCIFDYRNTLHKAQR